VEGNTLRKRKPPEPVTRKTLRFYLLEELWEHQDLERELPHEVRLQNFTKIIEGFLDSQEHPSLLEDWEDH